MKKCIECGKLKTTTEYRLSNNKLKDGSLGKTRRNKCRDCEREASRRNTYKYIRGVSVEERDAILKSQGYKCACCGTSDPGGKKGWHLDHCHTSNKIRSVLCATCNIALGMVNDSIEKLNLLIQYLFRHQDVRCND